jgi:hypothetical protein
VLRLGPLEYPGSVPRISRGPRWQGLLVCGGGVMQNEFCVLDVSFTSAESAALVRVEGLEQ